MTLIVLASLGVLCYTAWYSALCTASPFGKCFRCEGIGKYCTEDLPVFRPCPRCHGTGRRVRVGRRVYEYVNAEYERGGK